MLLTLRTMPCSHLQLRLRQRADARSKSESKRALLAEVAVLTHPVVCHAAVYRSAAPSPNGGGSSPASSSERMAVSKKHTALCINTAILPAHTGQQDSWTHNNNCV